MMLEKIYNKFLKCDKKISIDFNPSFDISTLIGEDDNWTFIRKIVVLSFIAVVLYFFGNFLITLFSRGKCE